MQDPGSIPDDCEQALKTVYATIRNVARNHHRSEEVRKAVPLNPNDVDAAVMEAGCIDDLVWVRNHLIELGKVWTEATECLTENELEVVEFEFREELTVAEIARHRGCTPRAVRKLRALAVAKLREKLDGKFGPE